MFVQLYQNIFFRFLDVLRARNNIKRLKFLRKSQFWSKEQIENHQLTQLNKLLNFVVRHNRFYQEFYKDLSLPLKSIQELEQFPILTKNHIRQHLEDLKSKNINSKRFVKTNTGGSTAEPMVFYWDKQGQDWNRASVYRAAEWAGVHLGEKTAQFVGSHYDISKFESIQWKLIHWAQRYKIFPVAEMSDELFHKHFQQIQKYKPTSIWGYTHGIYNFAKFVKENYPNSDFSFIKAVFTSSETLFGYHRELINEVFGENKVYDQYGAREMYIASECSMHEGYHCHSETVITELVNPDGSWVPDGERGKVLLTELYNYAFPLIRYEIGDVAIAKKEQGCKCGLNHPMLESIEGRIPDMVILKNRIISPSNWAIMLAEIEGIESFQIVQETLDHIKLNLKITKNFKKEKEGFISDYLTKILKNDATFEIKYVEDIVTPKSGKRRWVISKIAEKNL
ncbi:MAG: phenylacetate--CoA ligase family protein [Calditrichia bacterium]